MPHYSHFLLKLLQYSLSLGVGRWLWPGGVCRFEPTCSNYMHQALQRWGWRGVIVGLKRIMRCHPFSPGGFDPLPSQLPHGKMSGTL
jgi:putative membrane protein insertion efficiency factor